MPPYKREPIKPMQLVRLLEMRPQLVAECFVYLSSLDMSQWRDPFHDGTLLG